MLRAADRILAIQVPIVEAVLEEMDRDDMDVDRDTLPTISEEDSETTTTAKEDKEKEAAGGGQKAKESCGDEEEAKAASTRNMRLMIYLSGNKLSRLRYLDLIFLLLCLKNIVKRM
jgi:hypothetical protein